MSQVQCEVEAKQGGKRRESSPSFWRVNQRKRACVVGALLGWAPVSSWNLANYSLHTHHLCRQEMCKSKDGTLWSRGEGFVLCLLWPITTAQSGTAVLEISHDTSDNCQANLLYCKHGVLLNQYRWRNDLSLPQCARWAVPWCLGSLSLHAPWLKSPLCKSSPTLYDMTRASRDVNGSSHQRQAVSGS